MFVKVVVLEFTKKRLGQSGCTIWRYSHNPSSSLQALTSAGRKSMFCLKPVPKM